MSNNTTTHENGYANGMNEKELDRKLKELSLLKSPGRSRKTSRYLGDDEDHSSRAPRSAMSPSPRQDERHRAEQNQAMVSEMATAYRQILVGVGENPNREGLLKTPERAAKAMLYFTKGYDEKIEGNCIICVVIKIIIIII